MRPHFAETRRVLAALDRRRRSPLALAALLHDATTHAPPARSAAACGTPTTKSNASAGCWPSCPTIQDAPQIFWPRLQRVLVHEGAAELVALHAAIAGPTDPALAFVRERLAWPPDKLNPPPLIDGTDLIGHGLAPSPDFARLLEAVRDAQLRGEIETIAGAMTLVQRILDGERPRGALTPKS